MFLKRVYDPPASTDGLRVLVDRLWPRGLTKERAAVDVWAKEVAPSDALRRAFHGGEVTWDRFADAYRAELADSAAVADLRARLTGTTATLLFGARDLEHNHAVILRDVLAGAVHEGPA